MIELFLGKRRGFIASCAFLLGVISVASQVILIRELMSVFSGNELVFVVVLGVWLVGVALGSFLLRASSWIWVTGLFLASLVVLPVTILAVRSFRALLGIPMGSLTDIGRVVAVSSVLILPVAVILGGLFAVLARLSEDASGIYGKEAAGFTVGGILMALIFMVPLPADLNQRTSMIAWQGYELIAQEQSPYGHLMVIERGGQRSLIENGRHLFTAQDDLSAEEVQVPLLVHPNPKDVFLVGGGFSEAGSQMLKHPLERLDYAELDPVALRLEKAFFTSHLDMRIHLNAGDPRRILARQARRYDVIVINAGDPVSLLSARLFTREFYDEARRHLMPGGILSITMGLSEDYVNPQGKAYASSVYATLLSVFKDVQVVSGERMVWLASDKRYHLSSELLTARLHERGIVTKFIQGHYLKDRMAPWRIAEVYAWLDPSAAISTDDKPVAAVRALAFLTTRTGSAFSTCVEVFERYGFWLWTVIPAMALAGFFGRGMVGAPLWGMGVVGFTQMAFQVAVILSVQAVFGHAYAMVGVLTAGFMFGVFMGTHLFKHVLKDSLVPAGLLAQTLLAGTFMACWTWWPQGFYFFPVVAGVFGGGLFRAYTAIAGEGRAGVVYAADLIGAAAGAFLVGLFLVPLWGITATMLFVAAFNAAMYLGARSYPGKVSALL